MESNVDKLIAGLNWLAREGRSAAQELWALRDRVENIEEANAWLDDLENGKEP